MKKYAVVTDVSPSEQITDDGDSIRVMGLVVGLRKPQSFEEVGNKFPDPEHQLKLRKWSGSSSVYKRNAIQHALTLVKSGNVLCGTNTVSEKAMIRIGSEYFQNIEGKFPKPVSYNKKGKPRIAMGGYKVNGITVPRFDVLKDELIVLGWYAEAILAFHHELMEINEAKVKLDVIVDRLPLERGGDQHHKATLFKKMLTKASDGLVDLAGIPEKPDAEQRELLVDNIAGLGRELAEHPNSKISEFVRTAPEPVIRFTRINLT